MENMCISNICPVNSLPLKFHTLICFLTYLRIAYKPQSPASRSHIFMGSVYVYNQFFFTINLFYVNLFIRSDKELRRVEEIFFFSLSYNIILAVGVCGLDYCSSEIGF